jgi:hypothetical protein
MNVHPTIERNYRESPFELNAALEMAQRGTPVRQDKAPLRSRYRSAKR